ncbi:MAG: ammonium transporter [Rhizorhabdus sp.]|uniref:ammonium transporter n=1 Tax=Rhizorhabdus sp. TaxID=1968843 RepID=UPI001B608C12|nr:hypothetical protein [Rhizorhabdus sp.]MBP8234693.1 ammonium transporter [Rhizorhabdus sp.]
MPMVMGRRLRGLGAAVAMGWAASAQAAELFIEPVVRPDSGDTAFIIVASALVLFMTLPGLALFYGGLVRSKNFLSVLMQCFAIAALVSLLWLFGGYSLAFAAGTPWIGDLSGIGLSGMDGVRSGLTIPENIFALYQMMFAIITPALVIGAFPERVRFGWVMLFSAAWLLLGFPKQVRIAAPAAAAAAGSTGEVALASR